MRLKVVPNAVANQQLETMRPEQHVVDAARKMDERNISAVLVTDQDDKLIGIVTERDLARKIVAHARDPATTTLREIMTRDPITIPPDEHIKSALAIMISHEIRHLPIVQNDNLIGIVSMRDLRSTIAGHSVGRRFYSLINRIRDMVVSR